MSVSKPLLKKLNFVFSSMHSVCRLHKLVGLRLQKILKILVIIINFQ